MPIDWRPIDEKRPPKDEVLLYFPAIMTGAYRQTTLPAMCRVGHAGQFPHRRPSHYALLNPPEV